MNKKSKLTVKVLDNIACEYSDTKDYFEENLKEVCEVEDLTVENLIYFVVYLYPMSYCLWVFEQINGLLFHTLAILF